MTELEDLDLDSLMELINNDDEDLKPDVSLSVSIPEKEIKDDAQKQNAVNLACNLQPKQMLFSLEMNDLIGKETVAEKNSEVHTGLTDSSDEDDRKYLTETGMNIKKKLPKAMNYRSDYERRKIKTWKDDMKLTPTATKEGGGLLKGQDGTIDTYSGIRIVNPLISFDVMQQRMQGRKMIKMSFIKNFMKGGDIEGDWVTIGVVIKKVPPKTSKNGKTYSIWNMTDLHDCDKIVTVFLFGAAHSDHWKTSVGTVVGILNPDIMQNKDKDGNSITISVNHPGKLMLMGTSKDFGHCKAQTKNGESCKVIVNISQCEYCQYHVKKEYKKFSGQRFELQASYSGREAGFKSRVLKGENFFYAGQTFAALGKKPPKTTKSKDRIILSSLPLKRKAEAIENEERTKGIKQLSEIYGPEISKVASKNSEFINNQLTVPSAGSRNLLLHMMKDKVEKEENIKVITSEQLCKLQQKNVNNKRKADSTILSNLMPELGRGLSPGHDVALDFPLRKTPKSFSREDLAKLRAIRMIKEQGQIKKTNPNSVKKTSTKIIDIDKLHSPEAEKGNMEPIEQTSKLGNIDLNSKKIQEILNRKSSHAYEVEVSEMELEAAYFNRLEKKEQLELKMASTTEIVCDVVSCRKCKYTAHCAADRCKTENHPLKCHKALKRFFVCKDCSCRTCCFTQFPVRSCRSCGGSRYERTGMSKIRSGPKTDSEILNICSDDALFLNSL